MTGNYKVKPPIGGSGIKVKDGSDKGILYLVTDGNDYNVYPCLPGVVKKVDSDKVVIKHDDYVGKKYTSIYIIDGDIKAKNGQEVSQQTIIGVTDEEVEFKVEESDSKYSAKDFIGKEFGKQKETKMDSRTAAKCLVKNLIALPHKTLGVEDENDPCWQFKKTKDEPDDVDTKTDGEDKSEKDKKSDDNKDKSEDGEKEKSLLDKGLDMLGISFESIEKQNLIEEITRIKELLK